MAKVYKHAFHSPWVRFLIYFAIMCLNSMAMTAACWPIEISRYEYQMNNGQLQAYKQYEWRYLYLVPGVLIFIVGCFIFCFVIAAACATGVSCCSKKHNEDINLDLPVVNRQQQAYQPMPQIPSYVVPPTSIQPPNNHPTVTYQ